MIKNALKCLYNDLKQISRGNYFEIKKYEKKSLFWVRANQKRKLKDKSRRALISQVTLTKEQKAEIQRLYKENFGKKISLDCHKYYQAISDSYDKNYIPELVYNQMELLLCDRHTSYAFSNKVTQHYYFKDFDGIYVPKIYAQIHNGNWYSYDMHSMSVSEVAEVFESAGRVFAKPICDTSSGIGCELIVIENGREQKSGMPVQEYLNKFSDNYLFEEVIVCSEDVAKLHPSSVNTFRIITYRLKNEIFSCPVLMRVGRNNSTVDNAHAGGLVVGVSDEGVVISKYGVTEFNERVSIHPDSKIAFENYRVRNFEKALDAVKRMHRRVLGIDILSWDITLNDKDMPTFIEMNSITQGSWLPQITHGKGMFGDNTEAMLKKLRDRMKN